MLKEVTGTWKSTACKVRQEYRNVCLVCVRCMCLSLLNAAFSTRLNFVHLAEQKRIWLRLHLSDTAAVIRSSAVSKRGTWSAKRHLLSAALHHSGLSCGSDSGRRRHRRHLILYCLLFCSRRAAEGLMLNDSSPGSLPVWQQCPPRTGRFFTIKLTFSPDVITDREIRRDRGRWWTYSSTQQLWSSRDIKIAAFV